MNKVAGRWSEGCPAQSSTSESKLDDVRAKEISSTRKEEYRFRRADYFRIVLNGADVVSRDQDELFSTDVDRRNHIQRGGVR